MQFVAVLFFLKEQPRKGATENTEFFLDPIVFSVFSVCFFPWLLFKTNRQGIPIRGAEVQFLRKSLDLSMEKFGRLLGLSAPAILKWERARIKRLAPINEVAVRALMAEHLSIEMKGRFTVLKGNPETPTKLLLRVA